MSDEDDQKTDHVSQRRIANAFEEGQIPLGRDVVGLAGLVAATMALTALAPALRDSLTRLVNEAVTTAATGRVEVILGRSAQAILWGLGVCVVAAAAAFLATVIQTQAGFWPQLALPDVTRLWGGKLSRLFKREFLVDLLMSALKASGVATVAWYALRDDFVTLPRMLMMSPVTQLGAIFLPLSKAAVKVMGVMALTATADFAITWFRFRSKMKMTKAEAKREMREDEGDPQIKSRRRRLAREMTKGRAAKEVPRADALIVNPTHIAIAIRYRPGEGAAPRVTAKGKGQTAELMRELARSNQIPIVEDIYLARLLFRRVKVGGRIPAETYKTVAAILAFVYRVTGRSAAGRS